MKEIKDYLHLYLGCEVVGIYNDAIGSKGILTGITNGGIECEIQFFEEDGINVSEEPEFNEVSEVKLILRPLSDMIKEEFKNAVSPMDYGLTTMNGGERLKQAGELTWYLLSKHFDLFGLIPAGLAIDRTTIK